MLGHACASQTLPPRLRKVNPPIIESIQRKDTNDDHRMTVIMTVTM
jgi:hypothetical protein